MEVIGAIVIFGVAGYCLWWAFRFAWAIFQQSSDSVMKTVRRHRCRKGLHPDADQVGITFGGMPVWECRHCHFAWTPAIAQDHSRTS